MGCEKVLDICNPWTWLTNASTTVIGTYYISSRAIAHPSWGRGMTAILAAQRSAAWYVWKIIKYLRNTPITSRTAFCLIKSYKAEVFSMISLRFQVQLLKTNLQKKLCTKFHKITYTYIHASKGMEHRRESTFLIGF